MQGICISLTAALGRELPGISHQIQLLHIWEGHFFPFKNPTVMKWRRSLRRARWIQRHCCRQPWSHLIHLQGQWPWRSQSDEPCGFWHGAYQIQFMIKDLPFQEVELFNKRTDKVLHSLKDSRVTLWYVGVYTRSPYKKPYKYPPAKAEDVFLLPGQTARKAKPRYCRGRQSSATNPVSSQRTDLTGEWRVTSVCHITADRKPAPHVQGPPCPFPPGLRGCHSWQMNIRHYCPRLPFTFPLPMHLSFPVLLFRL